MLLRVLTVLLVILPGLLRADDRLVRLYAPAQLVDTGLLKFMLPRFSLKTQVRVEVLPDPTGAQVALGFEGDLDFTAVAARPAMLELLS